MIRNSSLNGSCQRLCCLFYHFNLSSRIPNTVLEAEDINIKNTRIGIASKDLSAAELSNIEISDTEFGFALYQKKPEFGPAEIAASRVIFNNNIHDYIVEENSKQKIDEKEIKEKTPKAEIEKLNF